LGLVAGWCLFGLGALCGAGAWLTDRALQSYRRPEAPASLFRLIPFRIREDLYRPEARPLIQQAWRLIGAMYGLALAGMLLIGLSS
jgi:hypothetical protein